MKELQVGDGKGKIRSLKARVKLFSLVSTVFFFPVDFQSLNSN